MERIVMLIRNVVVENPEDLPEKEVQAYVAEEMAIWQKTGKILGRIVLCLEGNEVVIQSFEQSPIKRTRRITGYLSTVDKFNDAKQRELADRLPHNQEREAVWLV